MKLDRKSRRALRAYMNARSLMMRLWSREDTYDLKGLLKEMENQYRHRSLQALCSLIKRIGRPQTKCLIDEAIANWKKSGAWRQDVWGKPDPKLVAIEKQLEEYAKKPASEKTWITAQEPLTTIMSGLQSYMETLTTEIADMPGSF